MNSYIALMRGINVGAHRKVPRADLRALCVDIGMENPQTYIQRGHLLVDAKYSNLKHEPFQLYWDIYQDAELPKAAYDYGNPAVDSGYRTNAVTPTFALIYKPSAYVSLYGSYVESLEGGARISGEYANFNDVLKATVSKQIPIFSICPREQSPMPVLSMKRRLVGAKSPSLAI